MRPLHHDEPGPPCKHMEGHLQRTADGSAGMFSRWYALAHSAGCPRCATFLDRLRETLGRLRRMKADTTTDDQGALTRLASGSWREAGSPRDER